MAYSDANRFLRNHSIIHSPSNVSIVRRFDSTVVADSLEAQDMYPVKVWDTGLISEEEYDRLNQAFLRTSFSTGNGATKVLRGNGIAFLASAYPFSPGSYAADHIPDLMIIQVVSNEAFSVVENLKTRIKSDVLMLSCLSFGVGVLGIVFVLFIVWYVSRALTEPLLWIERVAWSIVNGDDALSPADNTKSTEADLGSETEARFCVPTTELSKLVSEFRKMIIGFSGAGAASVAQSDLHEIKNEMTWQSDYQQLYAFSANAIENMSVRMTKHAEEDTSKDTGTSTNPKQPAIVELAKEPELTPAIVLAPPKKNTSRNIVAAVVPIKTTAMEKFLQKEMQAYKSSLFWWIVLLIALPLVLTNAVICLLVSFKIGSSFPKWHKTAARESTKLELDALNSYTFLKAAQAGMCVHDTVRELHFLTRAGWLFFDGLERSNAFCEVERGAQECASSPPDESCPFFDDPHRAVCACEWHDLYHVRRNCSNFTDVEARERQRLYFFGQARDANNVTGDRRSAASFGPGIDDSPSNTLWWDIIDELPGSYKRSNSSGFETTYDRLRVASATTITNIALFNYERVIHAEKERLTSGISFDADGLSLGYSGCNHQFTTAAHFESTTSNMASSISPSLCPEGKFGYDPRCRNWYDSGKKRYMGNRDPVYITAPYEFALEATSFFATTATSPIANPTTNDYAGQVFSDFLSTDVHNLFHSLQDEDFCPFVVAIEDDINGGNTVVPPGNQSNSSWESKPIEDLVLRFDDSTSELKASFKANVLSLMKNGTQGYREFKRTNLDGNVEDMTLAFAPVQARVMLPLDPSDYSRGVNVSSILVYSVGIAISNTKIDDAWQPISAKIIHDLHYLSAVYVAIVAAVSLCLVLIMCKVI
jgi:HAMP domain-containing protein